MRSVILQNGHVHVWMYDSNMRASFAFRACVQQKKILPLLALDSLCVTSCVIDTEVSFCVLKKILSAYYLPESDIKLTRGRYGKPILDCASEKKLYFSISHSCEKSFIAICNTEVGIDAENTQRAASYLKIAKRFFADSEYKYIAQAKMEERAIRFYKVWVLKEAYVKAIGCGLGVGMKNFVIDARKHELIEINADVFKNRILAPGIYKIGAHRFYLFFMKYGIVGLCAVL